MVELLNVCVFKLKLVNRQKCLDNMKVNGFSCFPKLGDSAGERYRSELGLGDMAV